MPSLTESAFSLKLQQVINTLPIYEALQAANFKEEQAKAIAHSFEEGWRQILQEIKGLTASKEETSELKAEIQQATPKEETAKLEAEMKQLATKGDLVKEIERLKVEMAENKADLLKWMFIFWVSLVPVMTGIMAALIKFIR